MNNTLTGLFDIMYDYYVHLNLKGVMLDGQKCNFLNISRVSSHFLTRRPFSHDRQCEFRDI